MIGMSCTHFSSRPMGEWIDRVAGSFRHWEIFSEADHIIVGREAEIRDMISSRGMTCSVHAPICDLNVGALTDRLMGHRLRSSGTPSGPHRRSTQSP